jgi:RNA polymerase sigma factor (sigma-70 family)
MKHSEFSKLSEEEQERLLLCLYRDIRRDLQRFGAKEQIEDILQEALTVVWEKLETLRDMSRIRPWARTIARNLLKKGYQQKKREARDRNSPLADGTTEPFSKSAEEDVLGKFACRELCQQIISMKEPDRTILLSHDIYGEPYWKIAKQMGLNASTVRSIATRGRRRLREGIREGRAGRE